MPYNSDVHDRDDADPTNQGDVYDAGYRDGSGDLAALTVEAKAAAWDQGAVAMSTYYAGSGTVDGWPKNPYRVTA